MRGTVHLFEKMGLFVLFSGLSMVAIFGLPGGGKMGWWDSSVLGADLLVNYADLLVDPVVGRLAR